MVVKLCQTLPAPTLSMLGFSLLDQDKNIHSNDKRRYENACQLLHAAASKGDPAALYFTKDIDSAVQCGYMPAEYHFGLLYMAKALASMEHLDYTAAQKAYELFKRTLAHRKPYYVGFDLLKKSYFKRTYDSSPSENELRAQAACRLGQLCAIKLINKNAESAPYYFSLAEQYGYEPAVNALRLFYANKGEREKVAEYEQRLQLLYKYKAGLWFLQHSQEENAEQNFAYVLKYAPKILEHRNAKFYTNVAQHVFTIIKDRIDAKQGDILKQCLLLISYCAYKQPELAQLFLHKALDSSEGKWRNFKFFYSDLWDLPKIKDVLAYSAETDTRSYFVLAMLALRKKNFATAKKYFQQAFGCGDLYACCHLSKMCLRGQSKERSLSEAYLWLTRLLKADNGWKMIPYFARLCNLRIMRGLRRDEEANDVKASIIRNIALYGKNKEIEGVLASLRRFADQGNEIAQRVIENESADSSHELYRS